MPIPSKRIISYIKKTSKPFSSYTIADALSPQRGKRKMKGTQKREAQRIDAILSALHAIGFLRKHKKRYAKNPAFTLEGIIRINRKGNGILEIPETPAVTISRENIQAAHDGDHVQAELLDFRSGSFHGRVTRIITRRKERYVARIERLSEDRIFLRIIDTPGVIEVCSRRDAPPEKGIAPGQFAIITLTGGFLQHRQECTIAKTFAISDDTFDIERIAIKHSLPGRHQRYEELKGITDRRKASGTKKRKDYRSLYTITIDGEDAKDFDDALSLESAPDRFHLYVHIADVSHFVLKGSPLDREAQKRGTSFYLGNRVVPMLPEILSNKLCSLQEGEDRFTITVAMTLDTTGKLLDVAYSRGIITVDRRLTYRHAQEIIDSGGDDLSVLLRRMHELALILKENRMSQGRIELSLPEEEIVNSGNDIDIRLRPRYKSHTIIEEFMLSANETVSRLLKEKEIPTLYRIHEDMSDEKLLSLKKFLWSLGIRFPKGLKTGLALQRVIESVAGKEYEQVVNFIILKSMMQAYYGEKPLGHFGLGFSDYTHFTSPIRRYPDLVVHRCLKSLADNAAYPYTEEKLQDIGTNSSEMERIAQRAERDLVKLKTCRMMLHRIDELFDVIVSGLSSAGFFVTLIDKPIEGMVPLRLLTDDYYFIQEEEFAIVGKNRGRRYRLGDRLRVRLVSVDIEMMNIDFVPQ